MVAAVAARAAAAAAAAAATAAATLETKAAVAAPLQTQMRVGQQVLEVAGGSPRGGHLYQRDAP